ncbi:acyltransferase family protein [Shivajiella indica]|uniref:Acyltransferase family protein n=1 Tax=Shivajiella indica TaxID=872115 RepID=A0ABW5B4A3_9BACT
MNPQTISTNQRLVSLDAYRGLTMFLLIAEAAFVYDYLLKLLPEDTWLYGLTLQFTHHPWNGLRFWDLIQPFFMFIVGVAMPFSLNKRLAIGGEKAKVTKHILKRCLLLFLFGTGLHCVYKQQLVFELWNVLTQLSFTILLTYFLIQQPLKIQVGVSMALLGLTEILYRFHNPDAPFVMGENFGSYTDMLLMGKINSGGWVAINCIPTAAHTIWGAICGNLLLSKRSDRDKIKAFLISGLVFLIIGYGLDLSGITPIIKRISTSAFVFASGGWALLALALFYWLMDVKKVQSWAFAFIIVGMNSIFIYLFAEVLGHRWLFGFIKIFSFGFLEPLGIAVPILNVFNALLTLGAMWYLCYFLYKKKIFFKI